MFLVYLQTYDDLSSTIEPFELSSSSSSSSSSLLTDAAKRYIIQEQGTRQAEEPIRTMEEMERDKYKLEKGYYLVWSGSIPAAAELSSSSSSTSSSSSSSSSSFSSSSSSSTSSSSYTPGLSIDICELTIGADGWVFLGTRTVKRYKGRFSICKLPSSPVPFPSPLLGGEEVEEEEKKKKKTTHKTLLPAARLGLTTEVLAGVKDKLRRAPAIVVKAVSVSPGTFVRPELRHVEK